MRAVLIAEENKVIRGLVRAIVQSAGFEPVETPSGEESFRMAQRGEYGAIVLDCLGRQGLETLKRLRAGSTTCGIPVIAMCGLGQYAADLGLWANAVIVKPFRPAQLLMKLQNAIHAGAAAVTYTGMASSSVGIRGLG